MKRRDFLNNLNSLILLGLSGAVPGVTLLPSLAKASVGGGSGGVNGPRYLVVMRAPTGWDVTLGLDPQIHRANSTQEDMYIEYRPEEILGSRSLRLAPAAKSLAPYLSDIATVNGVFMSDSNVSHEANLSYITTGTTAGSMADLPVEVGSASSTGPFGVLFNQSVNRASRDIIPTSISTLESLTTAIDVSRMGSFLNSIKGNGDFHRSQISLMKNESVRQAFITALSKQDLSSSDMDKHQAGVVAAAFSSRLAYQAQIDFTANLDTHSNHPKSHMTEQTKIWDSVAQLFKVFKSTPALNSAGQATGASLFDQTTFMVISEFSRTPALNPAQGKDHNPYTNSVLLAGAGIQGGQSFGVSNLVTRGQATDGQPRHVGGPVDYSTGEAAKTKAEAKQDRFQYIFPENIAATVAEATGVDRSRFANVDPQTNSLSRLLKKV